MKCTKVYCNPHLFRGTIGGMSLRARIVPPNETECPSG
uniref:Uncharacterized protein n=1 Tax=Podoviridae sp. cti6G1 TaxID=2826570 RepID=A0A8S5LUA7_9CAUD|nr:MAG TPA: hypothetical protein [Podoviridae sp. cti6G1]